MLKTDKIYVAGHRGMVGSACVRALDGAGYGNVVVRTHAELDLLDPAAVRAFYAAERPDVAIIAAARVGGIGANSAANSRFLYENEMIVMNTIWAAAEAAQFSRSESVTARLNFRRMSSGESIRKTQPSGTDLLILSPGVDRP